MKLDLDAVLCARCGIPLLPSGAHAIDGGPTGDRPAGARMTRSECRVFTLLCNGLSNRQIADQLVISENTVRFHLKSLYQKLGVRSRSHAVALGSEPRVTASA
jgi:DNA-binding CsgD family transcriptional regulator